MLGSGSDEASLTQAVVAKAGLEGEEINRIINGLRWYTNLTKARTLLGHSRNQTRKLP
jgi:hypothetical protein